MSDRETLDGPVNPDDIRMLVSPRSPERLAEVRRERVLQEKEIFGYEVTAYTCDDCGAAPRCRLAFDGYNINGDCLAEK